MTKTFTELRQKSFAYKSISFWGAGETLVNTFKKLSLNQDANVNIFDKNPMYWEEKCDDTLGKICLEPSKENIKLDSLMIITSSSYKEIKNELLSFGFSEENIEVSPLLNSLSNAESKLDLDIDLLLASGYPSYEDGGGGLFHVKIKNELIEMNRIKTSQIQNVKLYKNKIYYSKPDGLYLIEYDENINFIDSKSQQIWTNNKIGGRTHGISIDKKNNKFAIADSYDDCIYILNSDYSVIKKVNIYLESSTIENTASHHINDVLLSGDFVYYTCFSITGNWKEGLFNGALMKLNWKNNSSQVIISDLYMPHSIIEHDSTLFVADSMRSRIITTDYREFNHLGSFARGICSVNNEIIGLGLSPNRNITRSMSVNNLYDLTCGIRFINTKSMISKLITIPNLPGIHDISII